MQYSGGNGPGANTGYPCYPLMNPCPGNTSSNVYYADTRDYTAIINSPSPALTASPVAAFGNVLVNTASLPVGVTKLNGSGLLPAIGFITVTAPGSNFQVSVDGNSWGSSVNVVYTGGTLSDKNVYVRFTPTAASSYSGNITVAGGGISSTINVAVSGTGNATACSGTPSAGSASITPTSGGVNTSFTLSLSGATSAGGLYYQWQSSPNGTTWTNIPGGIYPSFSFTGLFANTQYRCIVTCGTGASATSSTATATYTSGSMAASGCNPYYGYGSAGCSSFNMWARISALTGAVGSISDVSSCSGATYDNFTSLYNVTLNAGTTYSATLQTGSSYYSSMNAQIFIDFNNNGLFAASESVGGVPGGGFAAGTYVATVPLVIPAGIPSGTVRMRVVGQYSPSSYGTPISRI